MTVSPPQAILAPFHILRIGRLDICGSSKLCSCSCSPSRLTRAHVKPGTWHPAPRHPHLGTRHSAPGTWAPGTSAPGTWAPRHLGTRHLGTRHLGTPGTSAPGTWHPAPGHPAPGTRHLAPARHPAPCQRKPLRRLSRLRRSRQKYGRDATRSSRSSSARHPSSRCRTFRSGSRGRSVGTSSRWSGRERRLEGPSPGPPNGYWESYKSEIAAYELDKLLGMDMVPPSVEKRVEGRSWRRDPVGQAGPGSGRKSRTCRSRTSGTARRSA